MTMANNQDSVLKATHFRSEGDVNTTPAREKWNESLNDEATQAMLKRELWRVSSSSDTAFA